MAQVMFVHRGPSLGMVDLIRFVPSALSGEGDGFPVSVALRAEVSGPSGTAEPFETLLGG
jgi:hypothetical protein